MKIFTIFFERVIAFFLVFVCLSSFGQVVQSSHPSFLKNELYVKIKSDIDVRDLADLKTQRDGIIHTQKPELNKIFTKYNVSEFKLITREKSLNLKSRQDKDNRLIINTFYLKCSGDELKLINELKQLKYIDYAERVPYQYPLYEPNDSFYVIGSQKWYLDSMKVQQAWDITKGDINNIVVAVLDVSFLTTHQDLAGKFVGGFDYADNDAVVDPPVFASSHGTKTSSVIGANTDNIRGNTGIGFNIKVMPLKIFTDLNTSTVNGNAEIQAILHAADSGAKVINLSFGGTEYSITQRNAYEYAYSKGCVLVASCGNNNNNIPLYPAAYNCVISVAAVRINELKGNFSSFGKSVDLTSFGGFWVCDAASNSSYVFESTSTSIAAPVVSAIAGLMLDVNPMLRPIEIEEILKSTSKNIDALNPGYGGLLGSGRVMALNAVQEALDRNGDFIADFTSVCVNQTITISLKNIDPSATYNWLFPGASPSSATGPGPHLISYASTGLNNISCSGTNLWGSFSKAKPAYINVTSIGVTLPFNEKFDGNFPPNGWVINNPDNSITWEQFADINYSTGNRLNKQLWMDFYGYESVNETDFINTPMISLSGITEAYLKFDVAYKQYDANTKDSLILSLSKDCGLTWNKIYSKGGASLATATPSTAKFHPDKLNQWRTETIDISTYTGSNILVSIETNNQYGNDLYLDNFSIYSPTNPPVADFKSAEPEACPNTGNMTFIDLSTNDPTQWSWVFENGTPSTANSQGPHSITYNSEGNFNVSLTVTNSKGSNSTTKKIAMITKGMKPGFILTFEDAAFPPPNWYVKNEDSLNSFSLNNTATGNGSSVYCMTMPGFGNTRINQYDYFYSNFFDLTGSINPILEFKYSYKPRINPQNDFLFFHMGNNCNKSNIYPIELELAYHDSMYNDLSLTSDPGTSSVQWIPTQSTHWKTKSIPLNNQMGKSFNLWFGFFDGDKNGNDLYIDDITIKADNYSPLNLAFFQLDSTNISDVNITWQTNAEIDNDKFIIERKISSSGSYIPIDSVAGSSSSYLPLNYLRTDTSVLSNTWIYYTLKCKNLNGYYRILRVDSIYFISPCNLTSAITSSSEPSCIGGNNGNATVTPSNGSSPFSFNWNTTPVQTGSTVTGLTANSYTVTVTDSKSCTQTSSVTLSQPTAITITLSKTDLNCNGGTNGTATATLLGGTAGFTYSWSTVPAQITSAVTGLSATASYSITVTDSKACTQTSSVTLTQPSAITLTLSNTNLNCNSGTNGTATATVLGGTAGYTYTWSTTPAQITSAVTGLSGIAYSITVTDSKSCTQTSSVTLTQPSVISLTLSNTNLNCNGGTNGTATATVLGGTSGYTYSWSTTPAKTTSFVTGLIATGYTVTVTDSKSCTQTNSVTLTQPSAFTSSISTNPTTCGLKNGNATLTVNGGTPGYTFLWNDPLNQTIQSPLILASGNYTVTISDSKLCTTSASANVGVSTGITLTANIVKPSCSSSNGSITIIPSGGTSAYTFSWNNGNQTSTINNLTIGDYIVTVTDSKSCVVKDTFSLKSDSVMIITITPTNTKCSISNGSASASVTGGTLPITYLWSNNQTTNQISNLSATSYTLSVTDSKSCTASNSVTLFDIPGPSTVISGNNASCTGVNNGSIDLIVNGGTFPITYSWNNNATSEDISGLSIGTYVVTVTDKNLCTSTTSYSILANNIITLKLNSTSITCFGKNNGSINVIANGANSPVQYAWIPTNVDNDSLFNLKAGAYIINILDSKGCTASGSVTLTQPDTVIADFTANSFTINNNDSIRFINTSSGASSYYWNFSNGTTSTAVSPSLKFSIVAPIDTFKLTVKLKATNQGGCESIKTRIVNIIPLGIEDENPTSFLNIFPNPANNLLFIESTKAHSQINVQLTDITGRVISNHSLDFSMGSIQTVELKDLKTGVYLVQVENKNYSRVIKLFINKF